ncbi:MAG: esterase, partial [Flaviaesturariibacter sp.]|nr:esterase [Flaviaesturariibacter sp.]
SPKVIQPGFTTPVSISIAVGQEEKVMINDTRQLATLLKGANKKNLQVNFQYFPGEDHGSVLHRAVYWAFETKYRKPKK